MESLSEGQHTLNEGHFQWPSYFLSSQKDGEGHMELFKIFGTIALRGQEQFQRDVNDATSKGKSLSNAIGEGLAKAAKVGAKAVAAAASGVALLTKQSISAYAECEQLVGGIETLFGAGGKNVEEYAASVGKTVAEAQGEYDALIQAQNNVIQNANNAYMTAGMSANEYMETVTSFSASLIQSLGGDTVIAANMADMAISDMSDNANKMGTDISSLQTAYAGFAKGNFTMLDNLKLGYGGTKEEMERLLRKAEELEGYVEGALEIDNFADIVEAINIVQTEMGITGTTAREASETITGSILSMKAAWKNLLVGFADENADFETLINNLITTAMTAFNNLRPRIVQAISGIATFASQIMPEVVSLIVANLPLLLDAGTQIITALGGAIMQNLPLLIATATELVTNLVLHISQNVDQFVEAMTQIMLAITNVLLMSAPQLLAAMGQLLAQLVISIIEHIPELIVAAAELIAAIIISLQAAVTQFNEVAGEWLNAIIATIDAWLANAVEAGMRIVNSIKDGIAAAWGGLVSWFEGIWSSLFSNRSVSVGVSYGGGGVNGSHADGLDYVPFDGYIAQLHKGESVLTAEQAKAWRAGKASSGNATQSAAPSVSQPSEVVINLTAELDGATVARKLYKYNLLEQRNHGTSLINA